MKRLAILLQLFLCGTIFAGNDGPLELTRQNYRSWMHHVRPSEAELRWTQIDWQPDLATGVAKAAELGKPILLWTMNGHPFGCT